MSGRKAISKKLRFEVFKRDSFTCQYCGKTAPDVVLHVDHINPVKRGGKNDILNLITSCVDCNLGKGATALSDNSMLAKQQLQLQEINERREQMELMIRWREELAKMDDLQVDAVVKAFQAGTSFEVVHSERMSVKKWIARYSFQEVLEVVELSKTNYLESKNGEYTSDSADKAWTYIPRICGCRRAEKDNPLVKEFNYIKGIVRNRCQYYFNNWQCSALIKEAHGLGIPLDFIANLARTCNNWSSWKSDMEDAIASMGGR